MARAGRGTARNPAQPLSIPNIEARSKTVVFATDFTSVQLEPEHDADFLAIVAAIKRGGSLDAYYRASTRTDQLLRDHQVVHLHLGGKSSDVILYAVQFPDLRRIAARTN